VLVKGRLCGTDGFSHRGKASLRIAKHVIVRQRKDFSVLIKGRRPVLGQETIDKSIGI
jgi:hypothetical protein